MRRSRLLLTEGKFSFEVSPIAGVEEEHFTYYSVSWTINGNLNINRKKYEIAIYEEGGFKTRYYSNLDINKTNSIDCLLSWLNNKPDINFDAEIIT